MQSRFTKKAQEALDHAAETAAMLGHGYIGSEHLLIGLIQAEDSLASTVLLNNDVTAEKIINLVYQLIAPDNQVGVKEPSGYTPRVRRILENSAKEAARFHADSIGTEHLLIAIIKETESVAARLLNTLGVAIKKLYVDTLAAMGEDANSYREDFQNGRPRGKKSTQTLDQYSRDLTELARNGKLDPVIGRSEEIQRVIQILSRRTKNNPCLIGEPGVGKTAIAEGLAARIVEGDVPETIKGKRLLTLDLSGMVAGSKYRGEFEERIKRVINEVKADGCPDAPFLSEYHHSRPHNRCFQERHKYPKASLQLPMPLSHREHIRNPHANHRLSARHRLSGHSTGGLYLPNLPLSASSGNANRKQKPAGNRRMKPGHHDAQTHIA